MPRFNPDDYEPVADRIERFWQDHPDGSITTEMLYNDGGRVIFKATVTFSETVVTGYASETEGSSQVNTTSVIENCETSAIGRALANLGYAAKKQRASREEMQAVERQLAPQPSGSDRRVTEIQEHRDEAKQRAELSQIIRHLLGVKYAGDMIEAQVEVLEKFPNLTKLEALPLETLKSYRATLEEQAAQAAAERHGLTVEQEDRAQTEV